MTILTLLKTVDSVKVITEYHYAINVMFKDNNLENTRDRQVKAKDS